MMNYQDTLKHKTTVNGKITVDTSSIIFSDSLKRLQIQDTLNKNTSLKKISFYNTVRQNNQLIYKQPELDTTNFYKIDAASDIIRLVADTNFSSIYHIEDFPLSFTSATKMFRAKTLAEYAIAGKDGIPRNNNNLKSDWMLPLILISTIIFIFLKNLPGNFLKNAINFLTLRDSTSALSRETSKLADIPSILFSLNTYLCTSLFAFIVLKYYNIFLPVMNEFENMMILFACSFALISARLFLINLTGTISEQKQIFSEYKIIVQTFYRISGIVSFIIVILITYTDIINENKLIFIGFSILLLLYLLRILKLSIIFIKKSASLFYLIFYLCGLEILPVAVLVKYLSGALQDL